MVICLSILLSLLSLVSPQVFSGFTAIEKTTFYSLLCLSWPEWDGDEGDVTSLLRSLKEQVTLDRGIWVRPVGCITVLGLSLGDLSAWCRGVRDSRVGSWLWVWAQEKASRILVEMGKGAAEDGDHPFTMAAEAASDGSWRGLSLTLPSELCKGLVVPVGDGAV
jgi:phage gp46-like protein